MAQVIYVCHPEVVIDPDVLVPDWGLSDAGFATMDRLLAVLPLDGLGSVWSSTEQKARDGAGVIARHCAVPHFERPDLGENDRSVTGYLVQADFDIAVDAFFGQPDTSYRGWETARDAHDRMVQAVRAMCSDAPAGDIALVAHGGVGCLLNGAVKSTPISRATASHGYGSWFCFDRDSWDLTLDWQSAPQ